MIREKKNRFGTQKNSAFGIAFGSIYSLVDVVLDLFGFRLFWTIGQTSVGQCFSTAHVIIN